MGPRNWATTQKDQCSGRSRWRSRRRGICHQVLQVQEVWTPCISIILRRCSASPVTMPTVAVEEETMEVATMSWIRLQGSANKDRPEPRRNTSVRKFCSKWKNGAVLAESSSISSSSSSPTLNLHRQTRNEKEELMKRCVEWFDPVSSWSPVQWGGQMMVGWVVVSCDPKGQTHPVGPNLFQPTRKLNPSSRPKLDLWTNTDMD